MFEKGHKWQRKASCHLPLRPFAESVLSGHDQIETGSLKVLMNDQQEERWEIRLLVRPNDITGKHLE